MARVTVEDCVKKVPNRFELVIASAQRARDLASGAGKTVEANDKNTVIALREIAEGTVDPHGLLEKVISSSQRMASQSVEEDDEVVFDTMKTIGADDPQFRSISERQVEDDLSIHEEDETDDFDDEEE